MNLAELILHSSLPVRELTESESEQLKQTFLYLVLEMVILPMIQLVFLTPI